MGARRSEEARGKRSEVTILPALIDVSASISSCLVGLDIFLPFFRTVAQANHISAKLLGLKFSE